MARRGPALDWRVSSTELFNRRLRVEAILSALSEGDLNRGLAIIAIFSFGLIALKSVFGHMKPGFGTFNVRIVGIVIVATLVSILAVLAPSTESAAIGILGVIAGYLFGYVEKPDSNKSDASN